MRWPCRGEWWRRALDITLRDQSPPSPPGHLGLGAIRMRTETCFLSEEEAAAKKKVGCGFQPNTRPEWLRGNEL